MDDDWTPEGRYGLGRCAYCAFSLIDDDNDDPTERLCNSCYCECVACARTDGAHDPGCMAIE